MKIKSNIIILGIAVTILVIVSIIVFPRMFIEMELESHLKSNNDKIILKDVVVIKQETDGTWLAEVHCFNKDIDYLFTEYIYFNSDTKMVDGYNVLEYV